MPDNFKGTDMEKIYDKARIAAMSREEYEAYWSEIFAEEKRLDEKATIYNEGKAEGVPSVTFPCAALHDSETGRIAIYYGCADTVTGLAFGYIPDIIEFTKRTNIL